MSETRVAIEYKGLDCIGTVITGDWEGDPDVVHGVNRLDPYVEDLQVEANGEDVTGLLSDSAKNEICAKILEGDS